MQTVKKFLLSLTTVASCAAAFAQESMMTSVSPQRLQTLIETARANYPRYVAAAARVRAAEAAVQRVKWNYAEALNFNYLYAPNATIPINGDTRNLFQGYQIGVYLNAGRLLQTPAQTRQAREEVNIARAEQGVTEAGLEAEVKARYYRYVMQQSLLKVRNQAVVDADNSQRDIKYKYEKGETSFVNYNQISITYAQQVADKLTAERDLLIAKSSLEELLGRPLEDVK